MIYERGKLGSRRYLQPLVLDNSKNAFKECSDNWSRSVQWGQPYAGFAVAEGQLSADDDSFQIVTWIQRYDGPRCALRSTSIYLTS